MKRHIKTLLGVLAMWSFGGLMAIMSINLIACAPSATPNPVALAPGYNNQADQTMGSVLSGARAFYVSIQQQSAAGTLTLSATEKTAFNQFGVSLNAAETVYLAYHNGQATQQAAQAAVTQVQTQQAALPIPGGK